jgi:hypothetical protein
LDVRVDIRPSNDVHYRVYGLRFLLNHGDMLGVKGGDGIIIGPIMRGEIFSRFGHLVAPHTYRRASLSPIKISATSLPRTAKTPQDLP